MIVDLTKDDIQNIISCIECSDCEYGEDHSDIIEKLLYVIENADLGTSDMKHRWTIKQDREISEQNDEIHSWTITNNPDKNGWNTDGGFDGYGLPKELAQWICNILNNYEKIKKA